MNYVKGIDTPVEKITGYCTYQISNGLWYILYETKTDSLASKKYANRSDAQIICWEIDKIKRREKAMSMLIIENGEAKLSCCDKIIPLKKVIEVYKTYTRNGCRLSITLDHEQEIVSREIDFQTAVELKEKLLMEVAKIKEENRFLPKITHAEKIDIGDLRNYSQKIEIINKERKEKPKMMDKIKHYYSKHEDVLFPLLVVLALDHFFNSGGLRERVVGMAQGLLDGIQNKLLPAPKEDEQDSKE